MKRLLLLCIVAFMPLSLLGQGISAIESVASNNHLPMRNLMIEVRQVRQDSRQNDQWGSTVQAQVKPSQSDMTVNLSASRSNQDKNTSSSQQVLVLNGRTASIVLGNSLPLQLTQTVFRNGVWLTVPGTVYIQANTGFNAQARWEGSSSVDLTLEAMQSQGALSGTSNTTTQIVVALDEWVTVARSDQTLSNSSAQLGGRQSTSGMSQSEVQIRVSVR